MTDDEMNVNFGKVLCDLNFLKGEVKALKQMLKSLGAEEVDRGAVHQEYEHKEHLGPLGPSVPCDGSSG